MIRSPLLTACIVTLTLIPNQAHAQGKGKGGGGRAGVAVAGPRGVAVAGAHGGTHVAAVGNRGAVYAGTGAGFVGRPYGNSIIGYGYGSAVAPYSYVSPFTPFGYNPPIAPMTYGTFGYGAYSNPYMMAPGYYGGGGAPTYMVGGGTTIFNTGGAGAGYDRMYPPVAQFGLQQPPVDPGLKVDPGYQTNLGPQPRVALTASVQIYVPSPSAELWFNGVKTTTQGLKREFVTPELTPGQNFTYDIRAKWTENGKEYDITRTFSVQAGGQLSFNFTADLREQLPPPK
jgi:uncharacterized protein (TIGR03000 family)